MDAIGYLSLGHVFTANMTGNTVLLGLAIAGGNALAVIRALLAVGGFVAGVALGASIIKSQRARLRPALRVRRAFIFEFLLLVAFAVLLQFALSGGSPAAVRLLISISAIAMGVQSVAVGELRLPGIITTFLTGTITSLVAGVVRGPTMPSRAGEPVSRWEHRIELQAAVFVTYGIAAAVSGLVEQRFRLLPTLLALAALGAVLIGTWESVPPPAPISAA